MPRNENFKEYFDAIFVNSNKFTDSEFKEHSESYDFMYRKFMPADKNAKIVDIGCGTGYFLYYLKENGYTDFMGVDISSQQVRFIKDKFGIEAVNEDAFEFLSRNEQGFDLITVHDVLEHIEKNRVIEFLKLIKASLRPGGQVFFRTPNMGNPMALRLRYADFTHEFGVTEKSFYQILYMSGFRDIKLLPAKYKNLSDRLVGGFIRFVFTKLMWYQGFVAPKIMTQVIFAIAKKEEQ